MIGHGSIRASAFKPSDDPANSIIVFGSYSQHPSLKDYGDYGIQFLSRNNESEIQ